MKFKMKFITKLFGSGRSNKASSAGKAIQKLRDSEEILIEKQDSLEKKIEKEIKTARQNRTKNKRVAIQALKRKKRDEKQLLKIDEILITIQMQRETLKESVNAYTKYNSNYERSRKSTLLEHELSSILEHVDDEELELELELEQVLDSEKVLFLLTP